MKKVFWSSEKILSLSAILISVGTLFTIIYQTRLMYKQQSASVLPYLEFGNSFPNYKAYKLLLVNNGIGPALIKNVKVTYGDTVFVGDPINFYLKYIKPTDTIQNIYYSNISPGRLIPAGKSIELMAIENSEENANKLIKWFASENSAIVEVEYTSVYDEKWVTRNGENGKPKKIK